jgi:hypothetical protein
MESKPFAEVVESSLHQFKAQSWEWDQFPAYGTLVSIDQRPYTLYGLVHETHTGSMDPTRYPFTYQKTEEELRKEQPQIFEFLKTTFSCILLGFSEKGKIHYSAAPYPAKIHAFVQSAESEKARTFFAHTQWLHRLFSLSNEMGNIDDLLLACLAQQKSPGQKSERSLSSFINAYALLTGNDYRRIKLFLQRVQSI